MASRTGWIKNLALAAGSLALLALLLEAGTRLFVPEGYWRYRDAPADWQIDREIGWVNRPNLDVESRAQNIVVHYRTNPDGLAPGEARREKKPGVLRILVFGDSMAVGRSLPQEQTYAARLEARLRARGLAVEVINAGVQGYSTDQELLLLERLLPLYQPDVVLYGTTLNDFGGIEVSNANAQAKPRFLLVGSDLQLVAPQVGSEIKQYGEGPRAWIQRSAFYRALQPRILTLRSRFQSWEERNLMGLMLEVYANPAALEQFDWPLFSALVKRMQTASNAAHARFFLFSHPEIAEVWPPYIEKIRQQLGPQVFRYDPLAAQHHVEQTAREAGVEFLAVAPAFRDHPERGPFHLIPYDAHLSAPGHEFLAEVLEQELLARGALQVGPGTSPPSGVAGAAP